MQTLLLKDLKDETDIVSWHDVLNDSIYRHKSNNYRPPSVTDLTNVLKTLQDKLNALVYCQRDRTPYIFDSLNESLALRDSAWSQSRKSEKWVSKLHIQGTATKVTVHAINSQQVDQTQLI